MNPHANRRLTVKDTMVLVAATAVGVAWARGGWAWMYIVRHETNLDLPPAWRRVDLCVRAIPIALPCLASWTLALLGLRLCPPRPRMRRLVLQPGTAACMAAALGLAVSALDFGLSLFWWWALRNDIIVWGHVPYRSIHYLYQAASRIAIAVASVWTILAISRRCRPEPTWVDRLGRILGVLWLIAAICCGWSELVNYMNESRIDSPEFLLRSFNRQIDWLPLLNK